MVQLQRVVVKDLGKKRPKARKDALIPCAQRVSKRLIGTAIYGAGAVSRCQPLFLLEGDVIGQW